MIVMMMMNMMIMMMMMMMDDDDGDDYDDDEDEDDDDDEDDDEDEYEDEDDDMEEEDNDEPEMRFSKKSKKKMSARDKNGIEKTEKKRMLKGSQHKLDKNKNGKLDAEDFKLLRKKKVVGEDVEADIQKNIEFHREIGSDGMPNPRAKPAKSQTTKSSKDFRGGNAWQHPYSKNMKKKMKKEETEWWNSVNGMISDPNQKFDDGFGGIFQNQMFTPVDMDNLSVAVREEPGPGEVGFAPSGKIATGFGMELTEARWFKPQNWRNDGDRYVLKGENGKEKVFPSLAEANKASEEHGGKAVKREDGWVVVVMKKVPDKEELKGKGSFSTSHYDMDKVGKPLNADRKADKVGQRKKLPDKN